MTALPYGRVLTELAAEDPDRPALVDDRGEITRGALESRANRLARAFAARGVGAGDMLTMLLPNGSELVAGCFAAWKLGAVPNPISMRAPAPEREALIERADPPLVFGLDAHPERATLPAGFDDPSLDDSPLPDRVSPCVRALASGGSTGVPKLIVIRIPAEYDRENPSPLFKAKNAVLVPGPVYHAAPFSSCMEGLLGGAKVVIMGRFDAARCLELIERHRVDRMFLVPTMMLRLWREPTREQRDVSTLEAVMTGGAPCPRWLMQSWIDWLGADVMCEAFGPSERIGGTFISGREWLAHPGSVGKPISGMQLRILDPETGAELPPGETGEIYAMPATGPGTSYRYVGGGNNRRVDGWESVGDMGWLDEDGYLYISDRRTDMILVGGRNVFPAEVEAAIDAHPAVRSSAVIGLPDEDLGNRIHAIVECAEPVDADTLRRHVAAQLMPYKVPRSFEFVDEPLRDDAGKVRRSALREARLER